MSIDEQYKTIDKETLLNDFVSAFNQYISSEDKTSMSNSDGPNFNKAIEILAENLPYFKEKGEDGEYTAESGHIMATGISQGVLATISEILDDIYNEIYKDMKDNDINLQEQIDSVGGTVGDTAHSHNNKDVLDSIEEAFTTALKSKLDNIEDEANNYSLPKASETTLGGIKVGNRLTTSDGTLSADIQTDNNFTDTLKFKLDNIEDEANNYEHPSSHSASMITSSESRRFVTDVQISEWNNKEDLNNKNQADGYAGLDGNKKIPLNLLPDTTRQKTYVVDTLDDRNNLDELIEGDKCFVLTGDEAGNTYIWDGTNWQVAAKADWENVNLDWNNIKNVPIVSKSKDGIMTKGDKSKLDNIESEANKYELPEASSTTLGGVIVGDRISVDSTGKISADSQTDNNFTNTLKSKLDDIEAEANNYSLPTASSTTLGGIKVGNRLSISSGVLTADSQTDNNFTNTLKDKLDNIESGANNFTSDDLVISPRKEQDSPPSEYPNGLYAMDSESDSPYSWTYDAGIVWGIKPRHSNYRHLQFIANSNGSELKMRMKNASEDNWQGWRALATQSWVSSNFNNYTLETHDNSHHSTNYEPAFSKNTAFNKNFGTNSGTVCQGNDSRLSNDRTPLEHGNEKHSETYATTSQLFSGSYSDLTDVPSSFPPESHSHSYLPLSGGTLSGDLKVRDYFNIRTLSLSNISDGILILCPKGQSSARDTMGTIYVQRSSGAYGINKINFGYSSASSNSNYTTFLDYDGTTGDNWSLITFTYDGDEWVGLRRQGTTYWQSSAYFIGEQRYTGTNSFEWIETSEASSISELNYGKKNFKSTLYVDSNKVATENWVDSNYLPLSGGTLTGNLSIVDNTISPDEVTFNGETSVGMRLQNTNGYVSITPLNTGWAHIYSDRSNFIFNKPVYTTANAFSSYNNDMQLRRNGTTKLTLTDTQAIFANDLTAGSTSKSSDTAIKALSDSSHKAGFEAYGASQGTGYLYVGQSTSHGGGIEYNGDNSPSTTGAGSDYITLYRRTSGTDYWTARNKHSSNDWQFRGNIYTNTNQKVATEDWANSQYYTQSEVNGLISDSGGIPISDTPPSNPSTNELWIDTSS